MSQRLGIIGAGKLGTAIGRLALDAGYEVRISGSDRQPMLRLVIDTVLPGARLLPEADVVADSDLVVLAIPFGKADTIDYAALEGKVVVVEEWGVNCGPCIASLPDMAKLAKRYAKKGLVVVGLEVQGGTEDEILDLLKEARVKYPVTKGGNAPVSTGGIPHACIFGTDGKLESPALITVVLNGILVQNNVVLKGDTPYIGYPTYTPHGRLPLLLQDHGTEVAYRNIWIREL